MGFGGYGRQTTLYRCIAGCPSDEQALRIDGSNKLPQITYF